MIPSRAFISERRLFCQNRLRERAADQQQSAGKKQSAGDGDFVSELDEAWEFGLAQAAARARAAGRTDIADYLALRSSNDLIRKIASDWLFTLFTTAAGEANRGGTAIQTSSQDPHRFKIGNAVMVGRGLELMCAVRRILVEVGWPRTPRDGFIRGGGLACANIKHIGIKAANHELRLVLTGAGTPTWMLEPAQEPAREFHEADVKKHLAILLDNHDTQQS